MAFDVRKCDEFFYRQILLAAWLDFEPIVDRVLAVVVQRRDKFSVHHHIRLYMLYRGVRFREIIARTLIRTDL